MQSFGKLIVFLLLLAGCQTHQKETSENETQEKTTVYKPRYAQHFFIEQNKTETTFYVFFNHQQKNDTLSYTLQKPLNRVVCTSTTHLAYLDKLSFLDKIVGISGTAYVSNSKVKQLIQKEKISEVGGNNGLNTEVVISTNPEAIFSSGFSSNPNASQALQASGIQEIIVAEWLETHPLGRTEWLVFFAYLFGAETQSLATFASIENAYLALQNKTQNITEKPSVITGLSYQGNWFVAGGKSFTATLLEHAGATYPWANEATHAGLQLDFETIFEYGSKTDVWIDPGAAKSKASIQQTDERLEQFLAFKNDQIYNNNRRLNDEGWNDFYESAAVQPEKVLADLIKIFHPEILPEHQFYFYQKLK